MKRITLGSTGIQTVQNAFGALPIQRISTQEAVQLLRRAYDGGMTFFDTARAYSDSEEKVGAAFDGMRSSVFIASKTMAKAPEVFWEQLHTSLKNLRTDYIDVYQLHCVEQCYAPGDGTGMYECLLEAKKQGKIRHIGITAHKLGIAEEIVSSDLYEVLQFPLSYLSSEREELLLRACGEKNIGFLAMKALAGGLITNSSAAMAYIQQFDNALPIWGIQRESELEEWLSYMDDCPTMTEEISAFIEGERRALSGDFCRGCGYCSPCPADIKIHQCARMSLMLRRAPSKAWLTEAIQADMKQIEQCTQCGLCKTRCPYGLDIPPLLKANYEDYREVFAGRVSV